MEKRKSTISGYKVERAGDEVRFRLRMTDTDVATGAVADHVQTQWVYTTASGALDLAGKLSNAVAADGALPVSWEANTNDEERTIQLRTVNQFATQQGAPGPWQALSIDQAQRLRDWLTDAIKAVESSGPRRH